MEYPGSILTKNWRRAFFGVWVALFFVLAPAIIMYTAGYRYDLRFGLLKEVGGISVDILPDNASTYLNGLSVKHGMPVRLTNLSRGSYSLKITAPGHYDWNKQVEVKSRQTEYIKDIRLLKKSEPILVQEDDVARVSLSPIGDYLIFTKLSKNAQGVWLFNIAANTSTMLFKASPSRNLKFSWAPNNSWVAISDEKPPYRELIILDAAKPTALRDIAKQNSAPIDKYEWSDSAAPDLYFSDAKKLVSYLPSTEEQYDFPRKEILDWAPENGRFWALKYNTSTRQYILVRDALGTPNTWQILPEQSADSAPLPWRILAAHRDTVLLKKNNSSNLTLYHNEARFNLSGDRFLISKYNNWWIFWTPNEIWTYSEGGEPRLLLRSGEKLAEVAPLDEFNTLALTWDNKTTALFPYYFLSSVMIDYPVTGLAPHPAARQMFFSATIGKQAGLWKLNY